MNEFIDQIEKIFGDDEIHEVIAEVIQNHPDLAKFVVGVARFSFVWVSVLDFLKFKELIIHL